MHSNRTSVWFNVCMVAGVAAFAVIPTAAPAGPLSVSVNGEPVAFPQQPPMETGGAVLVPLRGVFEAMGACVDYDGTSHTITAIMGTTHVVLPLGSTIAWVNGHSEVLGEPARTFGGYTLVPLRFVADALGGNVEWDSATNIVSVLTSGTEAAEAQTTLADNVVAVNPPASDIVGFSIHVDSSWPEHALRAGDVIHAVMKGSSGGTAMMFIPGVVDNLPMTESSPGVYTADFSAPDNMSVRGAPVLVRLTVGDRLSAPVKANDSISIDSVSPSVVGLSPGKDAIVESRTPILYARVLDAGGLGVDSGQVQMFLDGNDVSNSATATANYINYKPSQPLSLGRHSMRIHVTDRAGNVATAECPFVIAERNYIHLFTVDVAAGAVLAPGSAVDFRVVGRRNAQVRASIGGIDRDIPMNEVRPGIYEGSYTVSSGQSATEAPVTAHFTASDGNKVEATLPIGLNIAAGPPHSPDIVSPTDGGSVTAAMLISGTAQPNSIVRVSAGYTASLRDDTVPVSGSAGTREVTADADGNWSVDDLIATPGGLLDNPNTQITVSAMTIDADGTRSEASTIEVQGGKVYAHRRGQD